MSIFLNKVKHVVFCFCIFLGKENFAQSVAINTTASAANASSILDVSSTSKGLLLPRMSKAQKNAIAIPATGLLVYQNSPDSVGFHYFDGTNWLWLNPIESNDWKTTGNSNTDTAINFIGTTNNMPLRFKQNNKYMGQFDGNNSNFYLGDGVGKTKRNTIFGNIAIGDSAFSFPITTVGSNFNIAIGYKALKSHKAAQAGKIAIGGFALENDTSNFGIFNNMAIGYKAMQSFGNGQLNSVFGTEAFDVARFGSGNTVIGGRGLHSIDIGSDNTSLGIMIATTLTNGTGNTFVGARTETAATTTLTNATAIGYKARVDTSNALVLGSINGVNGATSNTSVGIGTTRPRSFLHIAGTGVSSTANYYFTETNMIVEDTTFNASAGNNMNAIQMVANDNNANILIAGSKEEPLTSAIKFQNNDKSIRFVTNATNANATLTDVIIDSSGRLGVGLTNPATSLVINGATTYIADATLTANAATFNIAVSNRTYFRISSDAAPASRKLTLSNGLFTGQMLIIQCIAAGANGFRIDDADVNIDVTGTTFNMLANDTITFIWDGNEWIELHRSDN